VPPFAKSGIDNPFQYTNQMAPPGDPALTGAVGVQESIPTELPGPDKLIPLAGKLPAIRLEATYNEPVSLRDCVTYAVNYNLPIRITQAGMESQKWLLVGQAGNFLPNISMQFLQQLQAGSSLIGGVIPTTFHTPFTNAQVQGQQYLFRGGSVLFGTLQAMHNWKASKAQYHGSINDNLLAVGLGYYNLLLQQTLLQIQIRAVDVSRAQLILNRQLEHAGTGTRFNVLQAETQLASDEQNLLNQQVAFRIAAINLATLMNLNLGVNIIPADGEIRKVRLIDPSLDINKLLNVAILNRPELQQYKELRLAARRNIQVQAAPLYPSFQLFGQIAGNGATLQHDTTVVPGSLQLVEMPVQLTGRPIGTTSNAPLSGGPIFQAGVTESRALEESRQMRVSYQMGMQLNWGFTGLGVPNLGNIQSARWLARQVTLQGNQQLLAVMQQVRTSYLNSQTAERLIDVSSKAVVSSSEQLRLARVRLANGVGTNIDVLQAQQVWVQALVNKASAIIQYNNAQVQLLHDLGLISVDTLTSGRLIRG
jgi:outer membrane protein TolC